MKLPQRPKRFIVIPSRSDGADAPTPAGTWRQMRRVDPALRPGVKHTGSAQDGGRRAPPKAAAGQWPAPGVKVVNRSAADGSLLLEPQVRMTLREMKTWAPAGSQVLVEQWYALDRPARPWTIQGRGLKQPRMRSGETVTWSVNVTLAGASRARVSDALVTVMLDEARGIGIEATTDRSGTASFELSARTKRVEAVYVDPLHTAWPVKLNDVAVEPGGVLAKVEPIDLDSPDARGTVYGRPPAGAGRSVRVAVVDTGVGPHPMLEVTRGLNTTAGESPRRFRDEHGHGTHVAGVIASKATGWRRGEASQVELHAYRIFEADDPYASSFAIAAAIKDAANQGCDLVNLSIGGGGEDATIRDAVEYAWAKGCVCVAATGNDGADDVDYPARYDRTVAVSAIGLAGSWPAGANLDWTVTATRGKQLGGKASFLASFSNTGDKVALTAPGVAIVSTIFGNRWGVMSGTSMATPIATGVVARRLATPEARTVLAMPRDARRAAAIVKLALKAAEGIRLPARAQGRGLAR